MHGTPPPVDQRLSRRQRVATAGVAGVLVVLVTLATRLQPDSRGYGTHTQLGMGECFVLAHWGVRCPSCGMTTAWTRLLGGDVQGALAANAGGAVLCVLAILAIPWLLASVLRGRWWYLRPTAGLLFPPLAVVALIVLFDWMYHTGLALLLERIP